MSITIRRVHVAENVLSKCVTEPPIVETKEQREARDARDYAAWKAWTAMMNRMRDHRFC